MDKKIQFVNPYSFIPFGKKKGENNHSSETLSGKIHYTVKTESPIFVPNTSNDHMFKIKSNELDVKFDLQSELTDGQKAEIADIKKNHKSYEFFSYEDLTSFDCEKSVHTPGAPVITGSEVRGMFRNVFEILTNSCMSSLGSQTILSKRTLESFKAGLIKKEKDGTYTLYQAKDYRWREYPKAYGDSQSKQRRDKFFKQVQFPEGTRVSFKKIQPKNSRRATNPIAVDVKKWNKNSSDLNGYIIKGEDFFSKKNCHIFALDKRVVEYSIELQALDIVLKEYQNNSENKQYTEYINSFKDFKKGKGEDYFPVYYSRIESDERDEVYLSPACKTREIYKTVDYYQPALLKINDDHTFSLYKANDFKHFIQSEDKKKKLIPEGVTNGSLVGFGWYQNRRGLCAKNARLLDDNSLSNKEKAGYVNLCEKGFRKNVFHVFELSNEMIKNNISIGILEKELSHMHTVGESDEGYTESFKKFIEGKSESYFPVYYYNDHGRYMLSPKRRKKEIFKNRLERLAGAFAPCKDVNHLCPACSLFGTLVDGRGISSKLRFTDLTLVGDFNADTCYGEIVTLEPLNSPKLNNMEFYLERPDTARFWTYDYYVDNEGKIHIEDAKLAGRKFYWHDLSGIHSMDKKNKLNTTIRPLNPGVEFEGDLYFNHITKEDLQRLIFTIDAGSRDNIDDKEFGYKIGSGKPLGLGSIRTKVESVSLRCYDLRSGSITKEDREFTLPESYKDVYSQLFDQDVLYNFYKMTAFNYIKNQDLIGYPKINANDEGFKWFANNHKGLNRDENKIINMPFSRNKMLYLQYMKALDPELKDTREKK